MQRLQDLWNKFLDWAEAQGYDREEVSVLVAITILTHSNQVSYSQQIMNMFPDISISSIFVYLAGGMLSMISESILVIFFTIYMLLR
jgi:hypothetical protein